MKNDYLKMTDRKEEIKKLKIEIKQKSEIKIQMTNLKKKKKIK